MTVAAGAASGACGARFQASVGACESPPEPSEQSGDTGQAVSPPVDVGEISEQEAKRMFDAVEEGDPRVVINPESKGGKDW